MRATELFETRYAPLYHGTSVSQMISAVHENKLNSFGHYISLTRDISVAKKFARKSEATLEIWMNDGIHGPLLSDDPTDEELAMHLPLAYAEHHFVGSWTSGGAYFIFDQEKIRTKYRLTPYTDDYGEKWEMEERIHRDLVPLRDYIVGIKLVGNSAFGQITQAILNGNDKIGLKPHPEYKDSIDFIRSKIVNTR